MLLYPGLPARCAAAWVWKKRTRSGLPVWEVRSLIMGQLGPTRRVAPMVAVAELIRESARTITGGRAYLLGCEDQQVQRNAATALATARTAGRLIAPLEPLAQEMSCELVRASVWRYDLLGLNPNTGRDTAKEAAVRGMPLRIQGLGVAIQRIRGGAEAADAAGVAEWVRLNVNSTCPEVQQIEWALNTHPKRARKGRKKRAAPRFMRMDLAREPWRPR